MTIVACVRDWRDFPLDYYRLPDDGRQWRTQALKRQALLNYLATFATPDGSSITIGVERMRERMGHSRATLFRWLSDLENLNAISRTGRDGSHGTAIRTLTLAAFVSSKSSQIPVSESQTQRVEVSKSELSESQNHRVGVSKSNVEVSNSSLGVSNSIETQPYLTEQTVHPTGQGGRRESFSQALNPWLEKVSTGPLGVPTKNDVQKLSNIASKDRLTFEYLKKAVSDFQNREQGFVGLKLPPWTFFLHDVDSHIARAKNLCWESYDWKYRNVPSFRAAQDELLRQQERDAFPTPRNEPTSEQVELWITSP